MVNKNHIDITDFILLKDPRSQMDAHEFGSNPDGIVFQVKSKRSIVQLEDMVTYDIIDLHHPEQDLSLIYKTIDNEESIFVVFNDTNDFENWGRADYFEQDCTFLFDTEGLDLEDTQLDDISFTNSITDGDDSEFIQKHAEMQCTVTNSEFDGQGILTISEYVTEDDIEYDTVIVIDESYGPNIEEDGAGVINIFKGNTITESDIELYDTIEND